MKAPALDRMLLTLLRDSGRFCIPSFQNPPNPNLIPLILCTSYPTSSVFTMERITSLIPGH